MPSLRKISLDTKQQVLKKSENNWKHKCSPRIIFNIINSLNVIIQSCCNIPVYFMLTMTGH